VTESDVEGGSTREQVEGTKRERERYLQQQRHHVKLLLKSIVRFEPAVR
jgi:hypothetical protein